MTTRTYNIIIDRLSAFASGHYILQRFTHGQIDEIDILKDNLYPLMHAVPTGVSLDTGTSTYAFDIFFADLPRDKQDAREYQREAISDMMLIAMDLVNEITNGLELFGSDVDVNRPISITPFIREFSNTLSGVTLSVEIVVPYNWNACDIPASYAVGGSGSGGSGGSSGGIILRVNGVDNPVQTILDLVEGSNMNIVDNGDGTVTFSATGGAGGGVETVTGLNTNNADPLNPVVRISVDGTTITGLGTPASPLISPAQATPTLQQVITAGATLTQANTIEGGGFDQVIQNVSKFSILSTGNQVFQRVNGGNSQAISISGAVISMFYITGSSERGFAAASGSAMVVTTKIQALTAVVRQPLLLTNITSGDVEFDSLTTADVADSTNRRYVTDAQQTVIGNTSGTNTGDETASTIKTKLGTTTVGEAVNTLTNPSAVTFFRINADNTVTARTAAELKSDLNIIDTVTLSGGVQGGVVPASTTHYFVPTVDAAGSTIEGNRNGVVSFAGNVKYLYFLTLGAQPASGAMVVTIRHAVGMGAFADTAVTFTIAAGAAAGIFLDITHSFSVAAGDRLSVRCANAATGNSASIGNWQILIERTQ